MVSYTFALVIFFSEVALFLVEVIMAVKNEKNRKLRNVDLVEEVDFINLSRGYRTSISFFRISLFIAYLILTVVYFDPGKKNFFEVSLFYFLGLILVYMLSLLHIKTFIFYNDYFIVSTPFNFFRKETLISYSSINDFKLYSALYNNFFLKLILKNNEIVFIPFSGSPVPKNNLIIRIVLNSRTGLNKDFKRKKWYNKIRKK
jgi:hypothetical protein